MHGACNYMRSLATAPHAGEAQALFLMVHGFTFHSQYFSELAQALLPYGAHPPTCPPRTPPLNQLHPPGFKSCTLDLTCHGLSR